MVSRDRILVLRAWRDLVNGSMRAWVPRGQTPPVRSELRRPRSFFELAELINIVLCGEADAEGQLDQLLQPRGAATTRMENALLRESQKGHRGRRKCGRRHPIRSVATARCGHAHLQAHLHKCFRQSRSRIASLLVQGGSAANGARGLSSGLACDVMPYMANPRNNVRHVPIRGHCRTGSCRGAT